MGDDMGESDNWAATGPETAAPKTARRRMIGRRQVGPADKPKSPFDPGPLEAGKLYRRRRYTGSRLNVLARQYVKVRSDLLVSVRGLEESRRGYAERCQEYLVAAREELESR